MDAESLANEILEEFKAGTLPHFLSRAALGHRDDEEGDLLQSKLVELHNGGAIDLIGLAASLPPHGEDGFNFWLVQDVYSRILVDLNAAPMAVAEAVRSINAAGGTDLAAGALNGPFKEWMSRTKTGKLVMQELDPNAEENFVNLALSLESVAAANPEEGLSEAIAFLSGPALPARIAAAVAMGDFDLASHPELTGQAIDALDAAIRTSNEDRLVAAALAALVEIHLRTPRGIETALLRAANEAGKQPGHQTIHRVAVVLFRHAERLSTVIVTSLTQIACRVSAENKGTISEISHAASALIQKSRVDEALALLEHLITRDVANLDDFESVAYAMLQLPSEQLCGIVVRWLLSGEISLGNAAASLVGQAHGDNPLVLSMDFAPMALSAADSIFLAKKAIGFLFVHPIAAASVILALLRSGPAEVAETLQDLLFDPLLINYPGTLADWLRKIAEDPKDRSAPHAKHAMEEVDRYLDGLHTVGFIPELRPSERERAFQLYHRQIEAREMAKVVARKSILASLMKKSVMLYGTRAISYFKSTTGESQRNETKLGQISHSMDLPRLSLLEPVTLDYILRVFRIERRPQ